MELLAPAGGWEQLEYAIHFGADAVYLAAERYGMRKRADNFIEDDIAGVVEYAHKHNVKVYITANVMMNDEDIADLPRFFAAMQNAKVDAIIVADMGALSICRQYAPQVDIHLSTQASVMNAEAAKLYMQLGVTRIVLAREMSLDAIKEFRAHVPPELEIEAFVHGSMCMAYSGRCLISDHINGRSANKGNCTQPCRWEYTLVEKSRPHEQFDIEEDERGSYIMSSTDMNMLNHLNDLQAAGITSIKIEGRAKGMFYVAMVVNAYRHVLDGQDPDIWQPELDTTSHRPFSTGFYFGQPGQNKGSIEYQRTYRMVGSVSDDAKTYTEALTYTSALKGATLHADDTFFVEIACRNRFFEGDTIEVVSPGNDIRTFTVHTLIWIAEKGSDYEQVINPTQRTLEKKGAEIGHLLGLFEPLPGSHLVQTNKAARTMERYLVGCPFKLKKYDILRKAQS